MLKSLYRSTADPGTGNFSHEELAAAAGALPEELRKPVADYLRAAPMFFAWMELTDDMLEGRFRVPGGSAINSDGVYYWRLDTADYVEQYGINVPGEFLTHAREVNWEPSTFDDIAYLEIYEELEHIMRTHTDEVVQQPLQTFYPRP